MCDEILGFLRIWSQLLKKSLMENLFFMQCNAVILGRANLFIQENSYLAKQQI